MQKRAECSYDELNIDRQTVQSMIRQSLTMQTSPSSHLEVREPTTPYCNPWDILMPRPERRNE